MDEPRRNQKSRSTSWSPDGIARSPSATKATRASHPEGVDLMSMKTDYDVVTHREGNLWVFTIPSLSATGQATSLSAVTDEARGIIEA